MIRARSGINYKEGKYHFGGCRTRDIVIVTIIIAISLLFSFTVIPNLENSLQVLYLVALFNGLIICLILPIGICKSIYMMIYYQILDRVKPSKYVWKGILWNYEKKETETKN